MTLFSFIMWAVVLTLVWRMVSQSSRLHFALDRRDLGQVKVRARAVNIATCLTLIVMIVLTCWRMPFGSGQSIAMTIVCFVGLLMVALMQLHAIVRLADCS